MPQLEDARKVRTHLSNFKLEIIIGDLRLVLHANVYANPAKSK